LEPREFARRGFEASHVKAFIGFHTVPLADAEINIEEKKI
jgi:hypothetical protein